MRIQDLGKRKKVIIISILGIAVFCVFYALTLPKESNAPQGSGGQEDIVPPGQVSISARNIGDSAFPLSEYSLNYVETLTPVINYTWIEDDIVYATDKGIFSSKESNRALLTLSVQAVSFSSGSPIVVESNNNWYFARLDSAGLSGISVGTPIDSVYINPQGTQLLIKSGTQVILRNLDTGKDILSSFDNLNEAFWSTDGSRVITSKSGDIAIVDANLKEIASVKILDNAVLEDISYEKNYVLSSEKDVLTATRIDDPNSKIVVTFGDSFSIMAAKLVGNNSIVAITNAVDEAGRNNQEVWRVDLADKIPVYMTDTRPIPRKLLPVQPLRTSADFAFIPLIENQGHIWIVSTEENKLPYYHNGTSGQIPLSPYLQRQDDH